MHHSTPAEIAGAIGIGVAIVILALPFWTLDALIRKRARGFAAVMVMLLACVASAAEIGPRDALLAWTAPTQFTDGAPITQSVTYRIYRDGVQIAVATQTQILLTNQPLGKRCYRVTAVVDADESVPTPEGCKIMKLAGPTGRFEQ